MTAPVLSVAALRIRLDPQGASTHARRRFSLVKVWAPCPFRAGKTRSASNIGFLSDSAILLQGSPAFQE